MDRWWAKEKLEYLRWLYCTESCLNVVIFVIYQVTTCTLDVKPEDRLEVATPCRR